MQRQGSASLSWMSTVIVVPFLVAASPTLADVPVRVQTTTIPETRATITRQFFGQVAALETVEVSFEVGGYLEFLEAREGEAIEQGERIAQLDAASFERAVERAELALEQAERNLERALILAERNVQSAVSAQDAETARDLANVALRDAREALSDTELFAPFHGLVAARLATAASNIQPGQPMLRLHNMSEVRVEFDLPERVLSQLQDPASVQFEGYLPGQNAPLPLTFREFRVETGRVGQSYTISLAIDAPATRFLLPGRTMVVRATLEADHVGHQVPASAIKTLTDGSHAVLTIERGDNGLFVKEQPVETLSANGVDFRVQGVAPGTEIVAVGAHLIQDGAPIERFSSLTVEGI